MVTPTLAAGATASLSIAAVLCALGLLTELLAYNARSKSATGSVAFIPYVAALLVYPARETIVAIGIAQAVVQVWHRRDLLKSTFNVGQFVLSSAIALNLAGRLDLVGVPQGSFVEAFRQLLLPGVVMFATMFTVNALLVSFVIALSGRRPPFEYFLAITRNATLVSALQAIFAIYLAWLSVSLGLAGAVGMALPILAVRQLTRTTVELTNVTEELLDLMVAAIEARDPYTSGHSKRVSRASQIIAKALGYKDEQVERIGIAALMHDVGKIDEQFARILAKEGRLTPEEWEVMKRHPVRSAELVGMLSSLSDIVPAVRHHHENWDGTGYPEGLRESSIPLGSRIIMFADTLDAITTDRPYRKALGPDEARKEFIKFRGKQFDPTICDVVVSPSVWKQLYESARAPREEEEPVVRVS